MGNGITHIFILIFVSAMAFHLLQNINLWSVHHSFFNFLLQLYMTYFIIIGRIKIEIFYYFSSAGKENISCFLFLLVLLLLQYFCYITSLFINSNYFFRSIFRLNNLSNIYLILRTVIIQIWIFYWFPWIKLLFHLFHWKNSCNSIPELAATETVPINILAITLIHNFFSFHFDIPQLSNFFVYPHILQVFFNTG